MCIPFSCQRGFHPLKGPRAANKIPGIQAGTVLNYGSAHGGAGNVETISGIAKPDFFPRLTDLTYNANRMATQNTDFISGIPIHSPAAVYAYDAAGNIVSDGLHTDYFYNQNNRLVRVEIDGRTVAEYAYDAFERRALKAVNGVTTHFHYDLNGLLVSETDGNGNPRKDYVYLNGEPVAMKTYGGSAGWYWFVNDHLGTPQKMVDAAGTVVWAAAYAPFGEARVYKDEVTNNLRFPGQYYDVETGLHYNWHRHYDPGTGRYLRPDPIGLDGGVNVYVYVNNKPTTNVDFLGLWGLRITAYWGYGGSVSVGYDEGKFSFRVGAGVGYGGGLSITPRGGIPKHPKSNAGRKGYEAFIGPSAYAGAGVGPFSAGYSAIGGLGVWREEGDQRPGIGFFESAGPYVTGAKSGAFHLGGHFGVNLIDIGIGAPCN